MLCWMGWELFTGRIPERGGTVAGGQVCFKKEVVDHEHTGDGLVPDPGQGAVG